MNYFVKRGDQQYGPYTLALLQQYVAQGNISKDDLAKSEAMAEWVPVSNIIGNVQVSTPSPLAPSAGALAVPRELPPGMHWGVLLLLAIVTLGIFAIVYLFIQASWIRKVLPQSQALFFFVGYLGGVIAAVSMANSPAGPLINLVGMALYLIGIFKLRSDIEEYWGMAAPPGISLSGVMTFFFNVVYFQYHLRDLRQIVELPTAPASFGANA